MTVLKTVEDVGATLAWYPGSKAMVALGTTEASGAGFDDYGAAPRAPRVGPYRRECDVETGGRSEDLVEICLIGLERLPGKASADALSLGLVAGGMSDGSVDVWDAAKMVAGHPQAHVSECRGTPDP